MQSIICYVIVVESELLGYYSVVAHIKTFFFEQKKGEVLRTATTDTYIQMTSVWFVAYIRSRVRETLDALHPSPFVVTTLIYLYSTKCV